MCINIFKKDKEQTTVSLYTGTLYTSAYVLISTLRELDCFKEKYSLLTHLDKVSVTLTAWTLDIGDVSSEYGHGSITIVDDNHDLLSKIFTKLLLQSNWYALKNMLKISLLDKLKGNTRIHLVSSKGNNETIPVDKINDIKNFTMVKCLNKIIAENNVVLVRTCECFTVVQSTYVDHGNGGTLILGKSTNAVDKATIVKSLEKAKIKIGAPIM